MSLFSPFFIEKVCVLETLPIGVPSTENTVRLIRQSSTVLFAKTLKINSMGSSDANSLLFFANSTEMNWTSLVLSKFSRLAISFFHILLEMF